MDEKTSVLCYNKGCGQRFDPSKNEENSCVYHPGDPVFHDAYKGWSCCSKKTTDFTEFLNIPGCATSNHSNVKPPEVVKEKPAVNTEIKEEVTTNVVPNKPRPTERPSDSEPLVHLKSTVTNSLKSELSKLKSATTNEETTNHDNNVVPIGTSCKNGGCKKMYEKESDNNETCLHHPGVPIFHEGMKFWTCCTKRTTDFDNFLDQVGCTAGNHLWIKPKTANDSKLSCRYDWYQTGPYVYITVYAKVPIPDQSYVKVNKVKLRAFVVFGEERSEFEMDLSLFGVVDSSSSSVQFAGNKVEIKLKKAEALTWSNLTLKDVETKSPVENLENNLDDTLRL